MVHLMEATIPSHTFFQGIITKYRIILCMIVVEKILGFLSSSKIKGKVMRGADVIFSV